MARLADDISFYRQVRYMNSTQMSKGTRRRQQILQKLKQQGRITVQEIIETMGCSEATARRDLDVLERQGELVRTIGGALFEGPSPMKEIPFAEKKNQLWFEKEVIAKKAAELIEEGDSICLSGGTTTYLIAKEIKKRQGITVVTNAVNIAMELADSEALQVVVIGGVMRSNTFELSGPLAEKTIEHLNIRKLFLGIDGLRIDKGITTYSELEAATARMMMKRAEQTLAVFDHSKVGKASLFSIAGLQELSACITDRALDPETDRQLHHFGTKVYIAQPSGH